VHDITFANEIIEVIKNKAKHLNEHSGIVKVYTRLSVLSHVKPKQLKEIFYSLVKDTFMEGVDLDVKILPSKIKCKNCQDIYSVTEPIDSCVKCRGKNIEMIHTPEFFVESIEVEKE